VTVNEMALVACIVTKSEQGADGQVIRRGHCLNQQLTQDTGGLRLRFSIEGAGEDSPRRSIPCAADLMLPLAVWRRTPISYQPGSHHVMFLILSSLADTVCECREVLQ
jgi:hypothetical protein